MRLVAVLGTIAVLLPAFAWVQSRAGYETFAWGGVLICLAFSIIAAGVTVISIRRKKN